MKTHTIRWMLSVTLLATLCACGGSDPSIQHRLPMELLAPTPPEARTPVADAVEAKYRIELEIDHTRYLLDDIEYELKIARIEKQQAKHEQGIARLRAARHSAAFKSDQAASATQALSKLKKGDHSNTEHIRYLKAQRTYLRKRLAHARVALLHAEAKFELAKAKLAAERGTIPKGFKLSRFEAQAKRTGAKAARRESRMRSAREKAKAREKAWKGTGGEQSSAHIP